MDSTASSAISHAVRNMPRNMPASANPAVGLEDVTRRQRRHARPSHGRRDRVPINGPVLQQEPQLAVYYQSLERAAPRAYRRGPGARPRFQ